MNEKGFSLVELIIVIILLGILSVITTPRFFNKTTFQDSFDRSQFSNALAWVRNRSITSQCTHEVRVSTSGWTTFRDANCSTLTVEPGCTTAVYNFNVAVVDGSNSAVENSEPNALSAAPNLRFFFTGDGRLYFSNTLPTTLGCTTLPANPIAANTSYVLSNGTLNVDGGSAFVSVQ
ncbi:prepilin-type N-terminal cleavage/methylation domain-containing protein [Reinekea forsetii]|nr:prepilin-type N-terminal cleavage/methylation domain-containing protein [Reinekea forsetii]